MSAVDPPESCSDFRDAMTPSAVASSAKGDGRRNMMEPIRFLQASDLRLDTPCYGVMNLPDDLRDRFVDARYIAAERVFDAAIEHDVDFVVLAGGLLDARLPGLRGPWFLAVQFRRLADRGIQVYWAGSTFETRGRWPAHAEVPTNVHGLAAGVSCTVHRRQSDPVARLLTIPSGEIDTFHAGGENVFTIAVQPRSECVPERWDAGIDYWALGGQSHRETVQVRDTVAHFAGSPQGRSPDETGWHSCSLVHVDPFGGVQIEPIATNVVRWHHERLHVPVGMTWSDLEQQFQLRQVEFHADPAAEFVMVEWTVTGCGLAVQRLLDPAFRSQLIHRLNTARPGPSPAFWTLGIEVQIDTFQPDARQSQPTTLGAFLCELQDIAGHVEELVGVPVAGHYSHELCDVDAGERLVRRVRNEGVRRLGTDEVVSTPPLV